MPLSRLENFIKNVEGTILYVNPTDQDATDSIENQGNSLTRPFKTIQRALIEAARFSYVAGKDNDKFDKTTIVLYPGIHKIDNRPGLSAYDVSGQVNYKDRFNNDVGAATQNPDSSILALSSNSNFDIEDPNNVLHYFNSASGGVVIPRGTSLVGMDLRKTKILPLFVPDPENTEIDNTAIFKITGGCYFWQFSLFDGDPNGTVYKNYTNTRFTPNFSHHKLTCFEYADGVNPIELGAVTGGSAVTSTLTDLDTYYAKIANAYGVGTAREIPSWPTNDVLQQKLAENQIVGAIQADPIGITSVFSTPSTTYAYTGAAGKNVVVTTATNHGLNVGTPIIVTGITSTSSAVNDDPLFNAEGGAVVASVISSTQFAFTASDVTVVANPHLSGDESVQVEPDTVTGASPYIFNISLRSVYGVNGLHADGSKATGFKSMVLAQFTGIGLQKDDNAFLIFNESTGQYNDNSTASASQKPLHINSRAVYKPEYESTHVKVTNSAVLQCVSIFAIGFSQHFVAESGGDQSITNSNSNFGAKALIAQGFRDSAFDRDNAGYVTHIIPPKSLTKEEENNFWVPINVGLTTQYVDDDGILVTDRLYTFGFTDPDVPPAHIIDSYRIGARENDVIKLDSAGTTNSASIIMEGSTTATNKKIAFVSLNSAGSANSITQSSGSLFGLTGAHEFDNGESVRIFSDDGIIPDGLDLDTKYFVIKTADNKQIKLAKSFNEAVAQTPNPIEDVNTVGGKLQIVSFVSDKLPGDPGHPIQFDSSRSNWYIRVSQSGNTIWNAISTSNCAVPLNVTSKTFIQRKADTRNLEDRIYKIRYVIPKEFAAAKPPSAGYVLQESSSTIVANNLELSDTIADLTDYRNIKIIHDVTYSAGVATVTSELPHRLTTDSKVKLNKIASTNNTTALDKQGFNGIFDVKAINSSKSFSIDVPTTRNPGTFIPNRPASATTRDQNHPNFSINEYGEVYYVYRVSEISEYLEGIQDGVYHLTCLLGSVNPTSTYFDDRGFSQNVVNLYPMIDRDNYTMDPKAAISVAKNSSISEVETSDLTKSITKEFTNSLLQNNRYGFKITDVVYDSTTGIVTATTDVEHNLNSITDLTVSAAGAGYGAAGITTTIYSAKLTGGSGEGATVQFQTVASGGAIDTTTLVVIDGGSGYVAGESLAIDPVGVTTYSPYTQATVTIANINRATDNSIQIEGVIDHSEATDTYNGVYRILDTPTSKSMSYLLGPSLSGVGTYKQGGQFIPAGSLSTITSIEYTDANSGIVTVTCDSPHGLNLGNSFKIDYNDTSSGITTVYNGTFTVNERVGLNTFTFNIGAGVTANPTTPSNVGYVLPTGYAAQEADTDITQENIARRMNSFYAGISTVTGGSGDLSASDTTITITDPAGFYKGDYLEIGTEIVRIATDFNSSNEATILRGVFATRIGVIPLGTLIKKIRPIPCESRRYSILRASGHTFEYLGFGPGNYSTALPQRQDRILSKREQLITQSEKMQGGVVVYTGMNDAGDFYVGNRRLSSATGQEETIGIPIPRKVGDDGGDDRLSVIFDDVTVKDFLKVEGGSGNSETSEFNGPVVFNNKVNFNSDLGNDFNFITLKGTDSDATRRKYTVGIATPSANADNSIGDVVFNNNPTPGGFLGWIFAGDDDSDCNNKWRKFGLIATEDAEGVSNNDSNIESPLGDFTILPSRIGINTNIPDSSTVIEVLDGLTKLDRLLVTGIATFQDTVTLGTVNIDDLTVNDRLSVSGTICIDATEYVMQGNRTISGFTTHTGDYDLDGQLQVSGNTSIGQQLTLTGDGDFDGDLNVSGTTCLEGQTFVGGNADIDGTLSVKGNSILSGNLNVTGNSDLGGSLQVSGNASLGRTIVGGNLSVAGTLSVAGSASIGGDLTVSSLTTVGRTQVGTTLSVAGASILSGNVQAKSSLSVGGILTLSGNANLNRSLQVSGNTSLGGNLSVAGQTYLSGSLSVKGTTYLSGNVTAKGNVSVDDGLNVGGVTNLNSIVQISGNTSIGGNLSVAGQTAISGTATIGRGIVTGNLSVAGNLSVDGNADFDGDLTVSSLTTQGFANIGSTLTVSGLADLNQNLQVSGNTQIGGTAVVAGKISGASGLAVSGMTSLQGGLVVDTSMNVQTKLDADDISASGQLQVNGTTSLKNTLTVSGFATLQGGLRVFGTASFTNQVDINGQTAMAGNLSVAGTLCVAGATTLSTTTIKKGLSVSATATIGRGIVTGNLSVAGNLSVDGNADFDGDLTVSSLTTVGRAIVGTTLSVAGDATFRDTLYVSGVTQLRSTLSVTSVINIGNSESPRIQITGTDNGSNIGRPYIDFNRRDGGTTSFIARIRSLSTNTLSICVGQNGTIRLDTGSQNNGFIQLNGQVNIDKQLTVTQTGTFKNITVSGLATFLDDVAISGKIQAQGAASFNGNAFIGSNLSVAGTLCVAGATTLSTTTIKKGLSVSGNITTSGQLKVGQQICGNGEIHCVCALKTNKNLHVTGTACIGSDMQVKGNLSVGGSLLDVSGAIRSGSICASSFEQTGNAPTYACRAFGKTHGSSAGEASITGKNVASISYLGDSQHRVAFTSEMPSASYTVVATHNGTEADHTIGIYDTYKSGFKYRVYDAGLGNNEEVGYNPIHFIVFC